MNDEQTLLLKMILEELKALREAIEGSAQGGVMPSAVCP